MEWLPPPDPGTSVCAGFDGSEVDDATGIRCETVDGFQFTPRYGPDKRPAFWLPAEWGGVTPRAEVHAAWAEINRTYKLRRVYCDPFKFDTELIGWALLYGEDVFLEWRTNRPAPMYRALDRFVMDLGTRAVTHDGCPHTTLHVSNARMIARGDAYILGKPAQHQKIDMAMTSAICHEAACDARADGWGNEPLARPSFSFGL